MSSATRACYGDSPALCSGVVTNTSQEEEKPLFKLSTVYHLSGFTVYLADVTEDVIAWWSNVTEVPVNYTLLSTDDDYDSITAWVKNRSNVNCCIS